MKKFLSVILYLPALALMKIFSRRKRSGNSGHTAGLCEGFMNLALAGGVLIGVALILMVAFLLWMMSKW